MPGSVILASRPCMLGGVAEIANLELDEVALDGLSVSGVEGSAHQWLKEGAQRIKFAGTLPPLAANWLITCLISQTFMVAESLVSPV